jgi:hypothetical protein
MNTLGSTSIFSSHDSYEKVVPQESAIRALQQHCEYVIKFVL